MKLPSMGSVFCIRYSCELNLRDRTNGENFNFCNIEAHGWIGFPGASRPTCITVVKCGIIILSARARARTLIVG